MKSMKRALTGLTLMAALVAGWFGVGNLMQGAQYARAQQQVDAAREQIANVQDMAAVYKAVNRVLEPSVVKIEVEIVQPVSSRGGRGNNPLRQWFPDLDGDGQPDLPEGFMDMPFNERRREGTGSGVIVEKDGNTAYIVTNNHVASNATSMTVELWDGRILKNAKVVGTDPKTDLAVLKIEGDGLIAAKWGDSSKVEKGDIILAFGSPFGYVGSMTHGIVSALNRQPRIISSQFSYENFIQVDAPINPGNSGGPLVNLKGEVIGINTAIATESGGFQGLGFAIPSNQVKMIYNAIKDNGRVVRGYLGVEIADVDQVPNEAASLGFTGTEGAIIKGARRGAPAYGALQPSDIVTEVNGKKVNDSTELRNTIASIAPGTEVDLKVFRAGKETNVKVKLGEQPDDLRTASVTPGTGPRGSAAQTSAELVGIRTAAATPENIQTFGLEPGTRGAVITAIRPGSPAQRSGLSVQDCIVRVNTTDINSPEDLDAALSKIDINKGATFIVTNRTGNRSVFVQAGE